MGKAVAASRLAACRARVWEESGWLAGAEGGGGGGAGIRLRGERREEESAFGNSLASSSFQLANPATLS